MSWGANGSFDRLAPIVRVRQQAEGLIGQRGVDKLVLASRGLSALQLVALSSSRSVSTDRDLRPFVAGFPFAGSELPTVGSVPDVEPVTNRARTGGANIESLAGSSGADAADYNNSPGEEALDVIRRDIADVAFRSDTLGKKFQDVSVLPAG
jgi:hypothetical protein